MRKLLTLSICACIVGMAADAPYWDIWRMNVSKTDFGESTLTYEQLPGGEWKMTMDGQSYTFKPDGKDYPTPWGMKIAVKAVDARTWKGLQKTAGKIVGHMTIKLGRNDRTLSVTNQQGKAQGGLTANDTMNYVRVSGGPGFAGKWRAKKFNSSSPNVMVLTPKGIDGLTILLGSEGAACQARFDGKDYPAKGKMWPVGWTCAIQRNGDRAFDVAWKMSGTEMYRGTISATEDGKTLTEMGSAAGVDEKYKVVYDRQ